MYVNKHINVVIFFISLIISFALSSCITTNNQDTSSSNFMVGTWKGSDESIPNFPEITFQIKEENGKLVGKRNWFRFSESTLELSFDEKEYTLINPSLKGEVFSFQLNENGNSLVMILTNQNEGKIQTPSIYIDNLTDMQTLEIIEKIGTKRAILGRFGKGVEIIGPNLRIKKQ